MTKIHNALTSRFLALSLGLLLLFPSPALAGSLDQDLRQVETEETHPEKLAETLFGGGLEESGPDRRGFLTSAGAGLALLLLSPVLYREQQFIHAQIKEPKLEGSLVPLREALGPKKQIGIIPWGPDNAEDLAQLSELFSLTAKTGGDTVWISGFRFSKLTRAQQQAIVTQAVKAGIKTLGFIDGNFDWPENAAFVRNFYQTLTSSLTKLNLGKLKVAFATDIEPYNIPADEIKAGKKWDGNMKPSMDLIEKITIPILEGFSRANRGVVAGPLLTRFEPFWYENGRKPDDSPAIVKGSVIKGLRRIPRTEIAGMTYRDNADGIAEVSKVVRKRAAEDRGTFQVGVETIPKEEAGTPSFNGKEAAIGPELLTFYKGLDREDQQRLGGVYIHTANVTEAIRVLQAIAKAEPEKPASSAKEFGIEDGKAAEFDAGKITVNFLLTKEMQEKRWSAVGLIGIKGDTWYMQPVDTAAAFQPVSKAGQVTVKTVASRSPFFGGKTGKRAVLLVDRSKVGDFVKAYKRGAAAASRTAEKIILIDEKGKAEVVEKLPSAGQEETLDEKFRILDDTYNELFYRLGQPEHQVLRTQDEEGVQLGMYLPTGEQVFRREILPAIGNPQIVSDIGSGFGHFALMLAAARPDILDIRGMEGDPALWDASLQVLEMAKKEGLIRSPQQVRLVQGNFLVHKPRWLIRQADLLHYYQAGAFDEDELEDLLMVWMKPGGKLLVQRLREKPDSLKDREPVFLKLHRSSKFLYERVSPLVETYTRIQKSGVGQEEENTPVRILIADTPQRETVPGDIRKLIQSMGLGNKVELIEERGQTGNQQKLKELIEKYKPAIILVFTGQKILLNPYVVQAASQHGVRLVIRAGAGYENISMENMTRYGVPFMRSHGLGDSMTDYTARLIFAGLRCQVAGNQSDADAVDVSQDLELGSLLGMSPAVYEEALDQAIVRNRGEMTPYQKKMVFGPMSKSEFLELARSLAGKRVGIFGFGVIGEKVARRLKEIMELAQVSFEIVAAAPSLLDPASDRAVVARGLGVGIVDERELFLTSDILSVHIPSTDVNKNYITLNSFEGRTKSLILINTARRSIVDDGLFATEPPFKLISLGDLDYDEKLLGFRAAHETTFFMAPHIGGLTAASAQGAIESLLETLKRTLPVLLGQGDPGSIKTINRVPVVPISSGPGLEGKSFAGQEEGDGEIFRRILGDSEVNLSLDRDGGVEIDPWLGVRRRNGSRILDFAQSARQRLPQKKVLISRREQPNRLGERRGRVTPETPILVSDRLVAPDDRELLIQAVAEGIGVSLDWARKVVVFLPGDPRLGREVVEGYLSRYQSVCAALDEESYGEAVRDLEHEMGLSQWTVLLLDISRRSSPFGVHELLNLLTDMQHWGKTSAYTVQDVNSEEVLLIAA